ncbi:cysteine protease ATG4A isoform X2 [Hydra vulgaris]|uniref:Cysteine protease n=1 Tax=Hydra vulgaris TaxID=6087 RepID=A0ABM4B3U0_HYDVU
MFLALSMAGPMMDAAFLTYEGIAMNSVESNLNMDEPVWILGKHFKPDEDMEKFNAEILTKFWFTYRRNFHPIGGTGPMSDTGWGCMLRCGQMMLAQALLCRHLGRDWDWRSGRKDNEIYMMILHSFLDKKDSLYSIHQIAQMGVGEGKQIGQWFGPNTVAQVIKKLVLFDDNADMAVHVAMDNTVVIEDIKKLCKSSINAWGCYGECSHIHDRSSLTGSQSVSKPPHCSCDSSQKLKSNRKLKSFNSEELKSWRPLLLFIPLRLGLSEINSDYYNSLKIMFTLRQSLGVIGGKPNHAHYFIGFNGDRLLYLDPHTTQQTIEPERFNVIPDESFHCVYPCFMSFQSLDPSVALGFYFHTEDDFDDWCQAVNELVVQREKRPMFEINQNRPRHWPPFELPKRPCHDVDCIKSDFTELNYDYGAEEKLFDSSGEYEIL